MPTLSIICIVVGTLALVGRGPLIFAPWTAFRFHVRLFFATNARFRAMGVAIAISAAALLLLSLGEGALASLFYAIGWLMAPLALLMLLLTDRCRRFVRAMLSLLETSLGDGVLRFVGLLNAAFGVGLIYVGGLHRLSAHL